MVLCTMRSRGSNATAIYNIFPSRIGGLPGMPLPVSSALQLYLPRQRPPLSYH
eukprot:COSAG03_NODE_22040_length_296_cov_0.705584_1_plen_52_part_01